MDNSTRNSRSPKRNEKGQLPVKVGGRSDYQVFKFSRSVSDKEAEGRTARLKEVYSACGGWNELSETIAKSVRKGVVPVPLPEKHLCVHLGMKWNGWVDYRKRLVSKLPTIPWATLSEAPAEAGILPAIRHVTMNQLNECIETISGLDKKELSVVAAIPGTLHEALAAYQEYITQTEPNNFDRHGKIRQLIDRHPDQPLATLGLDSCQKLFDYWRLRPSRHDGKGCYSAKRSRVQLSELIRFFGWMHISDKFRWREPEDFSRLDHSITKELKDRKSIKKILIPTFSLSDLATLVRHAGMPEKLWII